MKSNISCTDTTMTIPIPEFVTRQYAGGAREFKAERRRALKRLKSALRDLQRGCVWFPCGNAPVSKIERAVEEIEGAISAKNWGR